MPGGFILEVKDGKVLESIRAFLKNLLERKLLEALLVPMAFPGNNKIAISLVSDPAMLTCADPLAPIMPVNTARVVSGMTRVAPGERTVGVVLRSCELRALIELAKLKQASLDNLVLIGIDCFGTYPVASYDEFCQKSPAPTEEFLKARGSPDALLREACRICEHPTPVNADLSLGLIGMDLEQSVMVQALSPKGEQILKPLGLRENTAAEVKRREEALAKYMSGLTGAKGELFNRYRKELVGPENLLSVFASCTGCHNCRIACPLCYCRECFFDSPTFAWEADKYLGWAEKKGALRMPTDTLLYHLTRLNHMVVSCVGCGMCQEACPNNIPVFRVFRLVGATVQDNFQYIPGRSLADELPLNVFREDELNEVGQ